VVVDFGNDIERGHGEFLLSWVVCTIGSRAVFFNQHKADN
jgi:hypothetical protein